MKVFLSSTYRDLVEHRLAAAEALERLGLQGVRMEVFGARPDDATQVCNDEITACEAMVGIYAHRYGHVPAGQSLSITEQEYDVARRHGMPVFCFLVDEEQPWLPKFIEAGPGRTGLQAFKARLQGELVTEAFTTPHDLAFKLSSSLGRFLLARQVKAKLDQSPGAATPGKEAGHSQAARRAARLAQVVTGARVLLVNDLPDEMSYIVSLLADLKIEVQVETTTAAALAAAAAQRFDAVISDMARDGVQDEGLRFLKQLRAAGRAAPPVIFTVGAYRPELGVPAHAFGITHRVDECLNLLFDALERRRG